MSTIVADPGDATAQCFDALAPLGDVSLDNLAAQASAGLAGLRDAVALALRTDGRVPDALPADEAGPAYAALMALDMMLGDLDPSRSAAVPAPLTYLRQRLIRTGRLDSGLFGGAVMPRHCFPGRVGANADGLAGHLDGVIRVPQSAWEAVSLWRPRIDALTVGTRVGPLSLAAVPYYGERAEVSFSTHPGAAMPFYSAAPAAGLDVTQRVADSLAALDGSGAVLGLVPELTLDDATLAAWVTQIRTSASARHTLGWILIGTGSVAATVDASEQLHAATEPPVPASAAPNPAALNRAVLLDRRTGDVVLAQAKQKGFEIAKSNIVNWKLDNELNPTTHAEWLDSAKALHVLETAHGRLAILICEDLGRTMSVGALAGHLGVSIVLAPIFGATIIEPAGSAKTSWPQTAAETLATEVGTSVAACNSNAITRTYLGTGTATTTLFTVSPKLHPVTVHGVTIDRGEPVAGVDTTTLGAAQDAVTARTATM